VSSRVLPQCLLLSRLPTPSTANRYGTTATKAPPSRRRTWTAGGDLVARIHPCTPSIGWGEAVSTFQSSVRRAPLRARRAYPLICARFVSWCRLHGAGVHMKDTRAPPRPSSAKRTIVHRKKHIGPASSCAHSQRAPPRRYRPRRLADPIRPGTRVARRRTRDTPGPVVCCSGDPPNGARTSGTAPESWHSRRWQEPPTRCEQRQLAGATHLGSGCAASSDASAGDGRFRPDASGHGHGRLRGL